MSKRAAAAVLVALVAGIVFGIAWHEPRSMDLPGDIRTWVGFIVIIIGAAVALWQLEMQRRQLAGQQKVFEGEMERNKKRDALMAGQLQELEQRSLTYERFQAEEIDVQRSSFWAAVPGSGQQDARKVYQAEVANNSRRPIRDAACRLELEPGGSMQAAVRVGMNIETAPPVAMSRSSGPRTFLDLSDGSLIPLLRAGGEASFVFDAGTEEHPKARVTARFTDDTGLHWQIDPDLHLEKLNSRDW